MELSTKGRYAVMAMVDLALNSPETGSSARSVNLGEIAERQEISQSYLEQLFARLRRRGLVESARGPGGGYRLASLPEEISIGAIMQAVEEPLKVTRCDAHTRAGCLSGNRRCMTHDLWDELSRHIGQFLGAVTLADVLARQLHGKADEIARYRSAAAE